MVMTKNSRQMLMGDKKMTSDIFLESKDMRDKCIGQIELLDKVKTLFLLPELDCLTTKQVADYFEVGVEAIQSQYKRNKNEFDSDGVCLKKISDFKMRCCSDGTTLKKTQRKGFVELAYPNGTVISIPYCGIKCFPKRAILRMGMLLQGSRVSQEVRTQFLNAFEHTTAEQRTAEIDEEERLVGSVIRASLNGDTTTAVASLTEYIGYKNRYIAQIEEHNAKLTQENSEISEQKAQVEQANKDLTLENDILAKDILKWTDRSSANRLVKKLAGKCFNSDFNYTFNTIYKELMYKYGICVSSRKKRDGNKKSKIAYIKDNEWVYLYKVIAAIYNQNHLNVKAMFDDAKIDITGLQL